MDSQTQENCYQILGVHPRASQDVLDAAYRRLVRIHTGEYMDDAEVVAGPEPSDPYLARVDQAYRLLSDPFKRRDHDEALQQTRILPLTEEELAEARRLFEPTGAWLAHQRREDGKLIVRVGWASDFTAMRDALHEAVPERARTYNPRLNEWQIDAEYEEAVGAIFDNFEGPDGPPPPEIGPIYLRKPFVPAAYSTRQPWRGWPYLAIGVLIVATVATLLFPANRREPVTAQATATAITLANSFQPLESRFPTATPVPTPMVLLPTTPQFPAVNLRESPGTDAPVLALLTNEGSYLTLGRLADSSWFVVAGEEEVGWVAGWTVTVGGAIESLPVYTAQQVLPEAVPTPTPGPETVDEAAPRE